MSPIYAIKEKTSVLVLHPESELRASRRSHFASEAGRISSERFFGCWDMALALKVLCCDTDSDLCTAELET